MRPPDDNASVLDRYGLSPREREVFWLAAERLRNREIAQRLHIGIRTVETHVSTILRKIDGEQRDDIVALGAQLARRRITGAAPPAPHSSFVGREGEVAALRAMLSPARLITLVGAPGVGKTRLAFHVARTTETLPPPVLVDLTTTDVDEDMVRVFASAIGLGEKDEQLSSSLHEVLASEPVWLIVDNCEHVASGVAAVIGPLLEIEDLRILATSRTPLGLDGERLLEIPPLELPDQNADPAAALDAPACRLFLDRAPRRATDLPTGQAGAVVALCRRLDGVPLALELAAAQMRWFGPGELLDQLDERLLSLETMRTDVASRHRTIAEAIAWSYGLLDGDERLLLERSAVFRSEFELDVLVDVAGFDGLSPADIVRLLPRLVDASLVATRQLQDGTTTYRILDSIRRFSLVRLDDRGLRGATEERHARAHLERAVVVSADLTSPRQVTALAWFDRRWSDLVAAMRWAISRNEMTAAWRFLAGVGRRWLIVGARGDVLGWIDRLLSLPLPNGDLGVDARLTAAHLLVFRDTALAYELATDARSLHGDQDRRTAALNDLTTGKALAFLGRPDEAAWHLQRAVRDLRELDDRWHEALALQALGHLGTDVDETLRLYRRSARRFRETHDDVMLANTLSLMVTRAMTVGTEVPEIDQLLAEADELATKTGREWERTHVAFERALLRVKRGQLDGAEPELVSLHSAFRQMGDQRCDSRCLLTLGQIASADGDDERAVVLLRRAADIARRMTFPIVLAASLRVLAQIDARAGDAEGAARLLGCAEAVAAGMDEPRREGLPDVTSLRADLVDRLGDRTSVLLAEGAELVPGFPW